MYIFTIQKETEIESIRHFHFLHFEGKYYYMYYVNIQKRLFDNIYENTLVLCQSKSA